MNVSPAGTSWAGLGALAAAGLFALWLFSSDPVIEQGKKAVKDILEAVASAAKTTAGLIDTIGELLTYVVGWVVIVGKMIARPDVELGAALAATVELYSKGPLLESAVYLGQNSKLSPLTPAEAVDDRGFYVDLKPLVQLDEIQAAYPLDGSNTVWPSGRGVTPNYGVWHMVSVHTSEPMVAWDGEVYGGPPESGEFFQPLRYFMSKYPGTNVDFDGGVGEYRGLELRRRGAHGDMLALLLRLALGGVITPARGITSIVGKPVSKAIVPMVLHSDGKVYADPDTTAYTHTYPLDGWVSVLVQTGGDDINSTGFSLTEQDGWGAPAAAACTGRPNLIGYSEPRRGLWWPANQFGDPNRGVWPEPPDSVGNVMPTARWRYTHSAFGSKPAAAMAARSPFKRLYFRQRTLEIATDPRPPLNSSAARYAIVPSPGDATWRRRCAIVPGEAPVWYTRLQGVAGVINPITEGVGTAFYDPIGGLSCVTPQYYAELANRPEGPTARDVALFKAIG